MIDIPEVSDVDAAFGVNALDWMPAWEDIPKEFKRHYGTEWNEITSAWFYRGLPKGVEFHPKEGVDAEKAFKVVSATLGSFEPKHEHKEAAVAYMLSQWFEKIENWKVNHESHGTG